MRMRIQSRDYVVQGTGALRDRSERSGHRARSLSLCAQARQLRVGFCLKQKFYFANSQLTDNGLLNNLNNMQSNMIMGDLKIYYCKNRTFVPPSKA